MSLASGAVDPANAGPKGRHGFSGKKWRQIETALSTGGFPFRRKIPLKSFAEEFQPEIDSPSLALISAESNRDGVTARLDVEGAASTLIVPCGGASGGILVNELFTQPCRHRSVISQQGREALGALHHERPAEDKSPPW